MEQVLGNVFIRTMYVMSAYTKEEQKAYNSAYYLNNKEAIKANVKKWRAENNKRVLDWKNTRQRLIVAATPKWANRFFMQEIYALARLRTKITGFEWHVDHRL